MEYPRWIEVKYDAFLVLLSRVLGQLCIPGAIVVGPAELQRAPEAQVQQACVLESLSLGVASHLCSGIMQGVSVTIRSRLRNLLYYIHENCLVLLDMVCQRWMVENQNQWQESSKTGHCPENLNLDILVRVKRYRRLRRGEHVMALRQHNEMIVNVVRQLCRGAAPKRPPLSSRGAMSPGDRSPGTRSTGCSVQASQPSVLTIVNDVVTARMPLDRLRAGTIRNKILQYLNFRSLLNIDGADPDSPWPVEDPYIRYGTETFAQDGPIIWFEPLPPMLPNLEEGPKLPPVASPDVYTLVLDLDETLVHYFECDGMGNYDIRPGMHEFLERMNQLGYELVIFTAATQDYADWVIDQIDPGRLIHHRLYRQHALPWGPIFVKDLSRLGRDLDRTLIMDNVQENFMLQPRNGIFIMTWYEDPQDTALYALTPLLDELIQTRAKVPDILDKYRDQIPTWAGFDQYSQVAADYTEFDLPLEDGHMLGDDGGACGFSAAREPNPPMAAVHTPTHSFTPQPRAHPASEVPAADEYRGAAQSGFGGAPTLAGPGASQPVPARHGPAPDSSQTAAPGPTAYGGRYQPPISHPYPQQRAQGGYAAGASPLPAAQGSAHHEAGREQAPKPQATRPAFSASGISGPYQAAAPTPAPTFSGSGISGPYQAAPPPSPPMPANSSMWGQRGLGPYPVQARRR